MGILNLTPDSFSDGGAFTTLDKALRRTEEMLEQGAHIIDVGAESTRPFSDSISEEEEKLRLKPFLTHYKKHFSAPLSLDTTTSSVAQMGLDLGVDIINDISAFQSDPKLKEVVASYSVPVILMHMRQTPKIMQESPTYVDVCKEVKSFLKGARDEAFDAGIKTVILDPGIGFGKSLQHNLELISNLDTFLDLECPLLIGTSRKSFIEKMVGGDVHHRLEGTIASNCYAFQRGASFFRVHDVLEVRKALQVFDQIGVVAC